MRRRTFMGVLGAGAAGLALPGSVGAAGSSGGSERPNVLWITCEDISPHLGCYGDSYACTPNLDRLAGEGVLYENAFAHAPVCAPARSGLITGMYPSSLGSHHMRSTAILPPEVRSYPEYLREAGYYCTNNSKKDYNFQESPAAWDESSRKAHWKNRKPEQPFFSIVNYTGTHESKIRQPDRNFFRATEKLTDEQRHDPAKAPLPPYHPDTPEVRQDWARYHDNITALDYDVKELLDELEADGLLENTIVFFYGDHGAGMPRGKRWPYDSGIKVPLFIRFPEKYKHLSPAPAGSRTERLVSFVDFGPTLLSLCGVAVPEHMQGEAFLGEQVQPPRECIFAGRDRMDERYDCTRVVRDKRFKYIRNFMPHLPHAQFLEYMYEMPTMQQWQALSDAGKLNEAQQHFLSPTKPVEEFYDTAKDPHEVNNLAEDPQYREKMAAMRGTLHSWMLETRDLALMPESEMHLRAEGTPFRAMAQSEEQYPMQRILDTVDLQREGTTAQLIERTRDSDSVVRFWSIVGLMVLKAEDDAAQAACSEALDDSAPCVRIAASRALGRCGRAEETLPILKAIMEDEEENEWARLRALIALDDLDEKAAPCAEAMEKLLEKDNKYLGRVARRALAGIG